MKLTLPLFIASTLIGQAWALPVVVKNLCSISDVGCPNNQTCLHPTISGKCIKNKTITLVQGAGPVVMADIGTKCDYKIHGSGIYPDAKIDLANHFGVANVTVIFNNNPHQSCAPTVTYNP